MTDHFGQFQLSSPQTSPSLTKQHSFCRPTFNRIGRTSAASSPASTSYFLLLQPDLLNSPNTSPPTPNQSDLLKPEPSNDRLGPAVGQGDNLRCKDYSSSPSIHRPCQQQQLSSPSPVSCPVRPTFTRICGPRTPKTSATFSSPTSLLPSLPSSPMPLGSPGSSNITNSRLGEDSLPASSSKHLACSPSLSLSSVPSPAAQPSTGWYALSPLPQSLAATFSPSSLAEPNEDPISLTTTATIASPTNDREGSEPGTKEGSESGATVSAPGEAPSVPELDYPTAQPQPIEEKGSMQLFHKRSSFHRDRFPIPPPLYPTYSSLALKNHSAVSSAPSTAHPSAGSTPLLASSSSYASTLTKAGAVTPNTSMYGGEGNSSSADQDNSPSAPQDFLIEADLPYPAPATLQERQARQRQRAEQLRQLKIREEREAVRDINRRRSIGTRRRGSSVSLSLPPPAPSIVKGASSARTPKVAFDLRRTKIFEYDATGGDWDTLTIRTVTGLVGSPVSPVSPASLCSLFSSCQPSSSPVAMDEDTRCVTNGVGALSSPTVS
ncbi:hypothetical protein BGZ73_000098 [Actinomortierella ambigua]|nr:hypothetical protein BGZ73_000098 [Actinomortierella ambigua]